MGPIFKVIIIFILFSHFPAKMYKKTFIFIKYTFYNKIIIFVIKVTH